MNATNMTGGTASTGRPGVLSLNIRERGALFAAYMPFLQGGGLFIPTNRVYKLGDDVFMILSLMEDPDKIPLQGKVVWVTPAGFQGNRIAGIGVQFLGDEAGSATKVKIEAILGSSINSARPTHTM